MKVINNIFEKLEGLLYYLYFGVIIFLLYIVFTTTVYDTVCAEVVKHKTTNYSEYLYIDIGDNTVEEIIVDSTTYANYLAETETNKGVITHCYDKYNKIWYFYLILFLASIVGLLFWSAYKFDWG